MFKLLLALHLLFAIFAIGPLVHAATTAARGVRRADAAALASSGRMLKIYSYVSVLVIIVGMGLLSVDSPYTHRKPGEFGEVWIWLSLVLWAVSVALVLAVVVPALGRAGAQVAQGRSAASLTGRVAASGGLVGLAFAAIVFLMVYQPGH